MSKPILILNCGSSSIKYQMIDTETESVMAKGLVEKIGDSTPGHIEHKVDGQAFELSTLLPNHTEALKSVVAMFTEHGPNLSAAEAVGHRSVHGGMTFRDTTVITDAVVDKMQELSGLAPLHNPPVIAGIKAAREVLPDVKHVAIFDTAFFSSLPEEATTYAIDREVAQEHRIRKYGFHGTSHKFVSGEVAKHLNRPLSQLKQIVCHLGNGASISAIDGGSPIETSMGLTPLGGLVMGTRSGDLDPSLPVFLCRNLGMSIDEVDNLLNKRSGMFGMCGMIDMRDVENAILDGDEAAIKAMNVYIHRLVSYIGSYHALLGGLDTLTFTAGVGENSPLVRQRVCNRLSFLGIRLDEQINDQRFSQPQVISTPDSTITVLVVPTNEELAMAHEVIRVLN